MKFECLKLYWVSIRVDDSKGRAHGAIEYIVWKELTFAVLCKWRWYFDYRAALFKVQNPRSEVILTTGQSDPNQKTIREFLKDKISGKKRMITKISNQIKSHEEWLLSTNIFGLSGDDGNLAKAEIKLQKYKSELNECEIEMKELNELDQSRS